MITVVFYGKLRELFGSEMTVEEKIATVGQLVDFLAKRKPEVEQLRKYLLFSVNQKQASPETAVHDGDRVAIFFIPTGG